MENNQQTEVVVSVPNEQKPVFSNMVQTTVNDREVLMQFLFVRPNTNQATMLAEIVLTPQHAIDLQKSLNEVIKKHFTQNII